MVQQVVGPGARKALKDARWGWRDRTGHLRIMAWPVEIDRPVPRFLGPDPRPADPLRRPTGLAVGRELLSSDTPSSVRTLARAAGVSVAAAHATVGELARSGLVTEGRARHPDLFWAVADRWPLRWLPPTGGDLDNCSGDGSREPIRGGSTAAEGGDGIG